MGYYTGDYYRGDPGGLMEKAKSIFDFGFHKDTFPELADQASGRKFTKHELATGIEESGGRHRGRRMNPLNIHAARRAIRRLKGFVKVARKAYNFAGPKSRFKSHRKKRS